MERSFVKTWFLAMRPKTLWAAISPVLVGTSMAYGDGFSNMWIFMVTLLCAIAIQIGTNFANDYYDYIKGADTEERKGPTRATQAGWVTPQTMKRAFLFTFAVAFLCGLYLAWYGGLYILLIGIVSIICGVIYTGGPYPLGYNGLGDIFVLIFFGPVAVGGTYYLQSMEISTEHILCGFALGALATAIIIVNNLRDIETDRKVGKRTLAVRFGKLFTFIEYILCFIIAFSLPVYLYLTGAKGVAILYTLLPIPLAIMLVIKIMRLQGTKLNPVLGQTALLLLLYSLCFSMSWIYS
ncbi:1,4-dihydroxy-2-naphthoate polyprenyltransferase [Candidatus Uabimicrobium sp. HlEnr_7]|uniref:1,4-dihydroxy-2-naphthoate polyprenyltransferase n=1 Tax=Candidatus Uabimicrobium helgolandensis TaxID=3095367 RepID=UPI003555D9C2